MAIKITDECINCEACEPECPNNAIYAPGEEWSYADGTTLSGTVNVNGKDVDADEKHSPLSDDFFYIVAEKCTECVGFHDEPQCSSVCPVDCCVPDDNHKESEGQLKSKKELLHA